jgi:hypothetical protein
VTSVIHCGPAPVTTGAHVNLDPVGPDKQVILDIEGVEGDAGTELLPVTKDLLAVGSFVFLADGAVRRSPVREPTAAKWRRELELYIPVHEPDRWTAASAALTRLLEFATDDSWTFVFRQAEPAGQLRLGLVSPSPGPEPTCVALFSGGLDSLAGALMLVDAGERPVLASHWTSPAGRNLKDDVLDRLRQARPGWRYPNPTARTVRAGGSGDAAEMTQRSRGVAYLNLGVAVALQTGLDRLVVPENGVTSLNLAQSGQSVGAMRSRTTHPRTLALYRALLDALGIAVAVDTPFVGHTKADVIREALGRGGEELAHSAVSCSRAIFRRRAAPHCGVCSQCVDRRLAGVAAGWDDALEETQHVVDLFRDPLEEGAPAMYAEQYIRFAVEMREMTADGLAEHQDVWRAVLDADNPSAELARIHQLVSRHAEQVIAGYATAQSRVVGDLLAGRLPLLGLFRRIGTLDYLKPDWIRFADRLVEMISPAVRKAFTGGRRPADEGEVQRAIDVAQTAAGANLAREFPTVSYGSVGTRPDFSGALTADEAGEPDLFVEVKLVRARGDVRKVTDEMLADIPKYTERGRMALFLVFDAGDFIADETDFRSRFEKSGAVAVRVLR